MGDLIQAPPWKKLVIIGFGEDQMHLSKVGLLVWYDELVLRIAAPASTLLDSKNSDGSTPLYVAAIVGNEAGVPILVGRNRDLMSDKDKEGQTPSEDKGIPKTIKDSYGNNLLHLVGRLVSTNKLNLISRATLQIQREL
uniref:Ankyrin repeat-containing domain, PGG domain protein n=1 Tax=Tanacetum cinerariifolium TaxID=118510 RepID=A0A6L2K9P8_TANCI|nr:ankyrin repeat-containing domain, PGG domain protein [Tanacetum cinerariifolium]